MRIATVDSPNKAAASGFLAALLGRGAACLLFELPLYYNDGYILYETENLVILDE